MAAPRPGGPSRDLRRADPNSLRFCDQSTYHVPFRTLIRLSGAYTLPYGIRASAVVAEHSRQCAATDVCRDARRAAGAHTGLGDARFSTQPNTLFHDTVNQLDLSFSKSVRAAGVEIRPEVGIFNALNASPVTAQISLVRSHAHCVTAILPARLVRLGLYHQVLTSHLRKRRTPWHGRRQNRLCQRWKLFHSVAAGVTGTRTLRPKSTQDSVFTIAIPQLASAAASSVRQPARRLPRTLSQRSG